jgi:double-stranded uracil-DNA glycosylase
MRADGFKPIESPAARVLILGTVPSQMSLQQQRYYGNPQNSFWKIMGRLFGAAPEMEYDERVLKLATSGVAVWDVCASAHRPGSLDSSIRSPEPNRFQDFFESHSKITLICFNGAKAAEIYERLVLDRLPPAQAGIRRETLPSTSPANARLTLEEKVARWSIVRLEASGDPSERVGHR